MHRCKLTIFPLAFLPPPPTHPQPPLLPPPSSSKPLSISLKESSIQNLILDEKVTFCGTLTSGFILGVGGGREILYKFNTNKIYSKQVD